MSKRIADYAALLAFLAVTFAVAFAGSLVTIPNIATWYGGLHKPSFNPPNFVFGPVWTVLYLMMAVAAWLVWRKAGLVSRPMGLYAVQLGLNLAWSFLFFGGHLLGVALAELVCLWLAVLATLLAFRRHDPVAGWLFVPYLAWVSFAGALNAAVWHLNS